MLFQEEKEKFKQTIKALTGSGPGLGMGENSDWLRAGIQNGGKTWTWILVRIRNEEELNQASQAPEN